MTDVLRIRMPDDFHVHLRSGPMLQLVAPFTAAQCARALVMPNLEPTHVRAPEQVLAYRREILAATPGTNFTPLMTISLHDSTTPDDIYRAHDTGCVVAAKAYPVGVTNAASGVSDLRRLIPVYHAMAERKMVLSIHGELPGVDVDEAEQLFVSSRILLDIGVPGLKIVLEHVTTEESLRFIVSCSMRDLGFQIAATITAHHMLLTKEDWVGARLCPHHFCKPVAKTTAARNALIRMAISGDSRFFLGSDSAPHPLDRKECGEVWPGVFTAPVLMEMLATVFDEHRALPQLERFASCNGAEFYGLPCNEQLLQLERLSESVAISPCVTRTEGSGLELQRVAVRTIPKFAASRWRARKIE